MKFSDKYGYTKPRDSLQFEAADDSLRNRLWSIMQVKYWDSVEYFVREFSTQRRYLLGYTGNEKIMLFCRITWHNYYKEPLDQMGEDFLVIRDRFRQEFMHGKWYDVFNFLQWLAQNFPDKNLNEAFVKACNQVLEEEMSAYRFIGDEIVPITDMNEVGAIESAANNPEDAVAEHVKRSLELLSDRDKPDYRNSIKEAISAVEALAIKVTGEKSTLGQLLKVIDEHIALHPALKSAFDKLYGYTSDKEGIRHALMDQKSVDFEDAKFMLVTCCAFINYVQSKLK